MNKILAYTVIAILLGTVTMVVPLAVLGPSGLTPVIEYSGEPNNQERSYEDNGMSESGNFSTEASTTLGPAPETSEQTAAPDSSQQEAKLTVKTAENPSDLFPIGLMTLPSFMVALGVFVYLRKRMS